MFIAHSENTMRNAKPKFSEPKPIVRTIQQIRAENRKRAELKREAELEALRVKAEAEAEERRLQAKAVAEYRCIDVLEVKTPAKKIIAQVAALHGLSVREVLSNRRNRPVVEARFDAIKAVADIRPDMSLPQIGRLFGRDHTTILHALRRRGGRRA